MKKKKFGNSNLETDPIIFGGNVFGWTLDEKESFKILDEFFEKQRDKFSKKQTIVH